MVNLTGRQKLSLEHLKNIGITEPMDIIRWAIKNLSRSRRKNHHDTPGDRPPGRRHNKEHYQGIINYLAQQSSLPPETTSGVSS